MDHAFSSAKGPAANNGNIDINYQTGQTGFLLLQSMEHADTVPYFKGGGSSKGVSERTLSMSCRFCFGVEKKTSILESMLSSILWTLWVSQISMLRAYAFFAFQQPWLCAPVLCLWWGRAFDEHHQHRTWGSSPWYRWFASGFVEEGIFVGSARCATFRLCSGALRAGTTQCIQEHRSSNGMWGSVEEAMGSDCVHPVDMFCSRPEKGVVNFTVPKISPCQKFHRPRSFAAKIDTKNHLQQGG